MSKQRRNGVARSLGGDIFITVVLIVVAAFMMLPFDICDHAVPQTD